MSELPQSGQQGVANTAPIAISSRRELLAPLSRQNPVLVQLLGLCPLLAVSNSTVNGLALGAASLFVVTMSALIVSATKRLIPHQMRLPALVLIIAGATTLAMLITQAFAYEIYARLGLFLQIIVTNCAILAQAEQVARRRPVWYATAHGFMTGIGFACVLITLGVIREIIGSGTLFAGMERLFGATAASWELQIHGSGFLLAALPPGAFVITGLMIALHRLWLRRSETEPSTLVPGQHSRL